MCSTEEQIAIVLRQAESGTPVFEVIGQLLEPNHSGLEIGGIGSVE